MTCIENLVNAYYIRDKEMYINNNSTIIKALKKLGYYNIDINTELSNNYINKLLDKIKNELTNNFNSNIRNKTLNELIIYEAEPSILNRYNRSIELVRYLDKEDTFDFYNSLNIDELEYLGY